MGQVQVWIEQGPQAIIAAVIRGQAPQELRLTLKEKLEEAHRLFSRELEEFDGNPAPFETFRPELVACLTASYRHQKPAKSRPYLPVGATVVALLLAGWLGYSAIQNHKWALYVENLKQQPGIVVTSFQKAGGRYRIQGLRDPLAVDPSSLLGKLNPRSAEFHWSAFYALDDSLVLKRAIALLHPPADVTLSVQDGVLHAAGDSSAEWKKSMQERAPLIAGVTAVDDQDLNDENSPKRLKAALESRVILFDIARAEVSPRQRQGLEAAAQAIQKLLQKVPSPGGSAIVELVGHADSSGLESTNVLLSQERANNAMRALAQLGVPVQSLRATGVGLSSPLRPETDEENRQYNRSVTFRVVGSATPQNR